MRTGYLSLLCVLFFANTAFSTLLQSSGGSVVGDYKSMHVTFTVSDLRTDQTKVGAATADLVQNISIVLPKSDPTSPILYVPIGKSPSSTPVAGFNSNFYWQEVSANISVDNADRPTNKIAYDINILVNTAISGPAKLSDQVETDGSGSIKVIVQFNNFLSSNGTYANDATNRQPPFLIRKIFSSPNAAPTSFGVEASNRGLKMKWDTGSVAYTPDTTVNQTPDSVLIMVFNPGVGVVQLDGFVASKTANPKKAGCKYTENETNCIMCDPGADIYVSDTPPETDMIQSFTLVNNAAKEFIVKGLDPSQEYTVVLQYLQGVKRTECIVGQPYINYSLTELNKGDESHQGDPRCFIVSAAYGSPFNRHVDIFRWARDRFLEPFAWGREVVEYYYNHSQPFADTIRESPRLALAVRAFLWPTAALLYISKLLLDSPALASIFCFCLFFGLGALSLVTIRKWNRRTAR